MRRLSTLQALMIAGALTAACGDDGAGSGGEGGAGGRDTTTATTSDSTTTNGPTTTTTTSTTADTTTTTTASTSTGEGGMGTGGMGTGGEGTGGGTGCIAITPEGFVTSDAGNEQSEFISVFTPNVDGAEDDYAVVQLYGFDPYNGGDPGTFDLTMNGDDNYSTCSRCFLAVVDAEGAAPRFFFQSAGTVDVGGSAPLDGALTATVTNLTLVEVTIDEQTAVSTPVPGGACLEIAAADIHTAPAGWTCDPALYDEGSECNCGCGIVDPDCAGNTSASCDSCNDIGSCDEAGTDCSQIDPSDNSGCSAPSGWTCDPDYYGGSDGCDCGCGIVDPDCDDALAASCEYCEEMASCGNVANIPFLCDISAINPTNNAVCTGTAATWSCDPDYFSDFYCDCGCGFVDADCADATPASCEYCEVPSCASDGMDGCVESMLDPTNNGVCL